MDSVAIWITAVGDRRTKPAFLRDLPAQSAAEIEFKSLPLAQPCTCHTKNSVSPPDTPKFERMKWKEEKWWKMPLIKKNWFSDKVMREVQAWSISNVFVYWSLCQHQPFPPNHPSPWRKVSQNFHRHSSNFAKATMCPRVERFCQRYLPKQIQKQLIYMYIFTRTLTIFIKYYHLLNII